MFIACDFGLVPDTDRFSGAADFRFVLFRFEPKWGFRAGWAKLQSVFPDYFTVRSRTQGIWMPFTDVSTVPLTFTSDTRQPALFKGLAVFEFTRWISDDVHRLGRLVFANGVPYRFGFLCP